jgi:hypothetical protein
MIDRPDALTVRHCLPIQGRADWPMGRARIPSSFSSVIQSVARKRNGGRMASFSSVIPSRRSRRAARLANGFHVTPCPGPLSAGMSRTQYKASRRDMDSGARGMSRLVNTAIGPARRAYASARRAASMPIAKRNKIARTVFAQMRIDCVSDQRKHVRDIRGCEMGQGGDGGILRP